MRLGLRQRSRSGSASLLLGGCFYPTPRKGKINLKPPPLNQRCGVLVAVSPLPGRRLAGIGPKAAPRSAREVFRLSNRRSAVVSLIGPSHSGLYLDKIRVFAIAYNPTNGSLITIRIYDLDGCRLL